MSLDPDIRRLAQQIEHHNRLYWELNTPEISDHAYDALVEELRRLDPKHPLLDRLEQAPQLDLFSTQEASPQARFGQAVRHEHPMLSLNKAYDFEVVERWFSSFDGGVVVMPKVDGIACSLRYASSGDLTYAATRGNGRVGEDITANILAAECVPAHLDGLVGAAEVRGEVYIATQDFQEHLAERFSNPRNTASGAIKQKNHEGTRAYHLRFFAYDLIVSDQPDEKTKFERLEAMGFARTEHTLCADYEAVEDTVRRYTDDRATLPYETDGVVMRTARSSEQIRLGLTAHHPRFALAFKFSGDVAQTTLVDVHWQVARTGTITPVAQLEPVELSGAMVSKASLHHAGRVETLELAVPAQVVAARRGGVIPHVEGVLKLGDKPIEIPRTCPGCEAPTTRREDFLMCSRPQECRPARIASLVHWCQALDLDGLGQKLAEQLYDHGFAQRPIDLYGLTREQLITLPRFAERSAENLLAQIEQSRAIDGAAFLVGLGIDDLGVTVARRLLDELGSLERLLEATEARLLEIDGIGAITGAGITKALHERAEEIERLLEVLDVNESKPAPGDKQGALDGFWVVFTGTLASSDRKSAQAVARQHGAKTPSSVASTGQGILVIGDRNSALTGEGRVSTKHAKARSQIRQGADLVIIAETEWLEWIDGNASIEELRAQWSGQAR